ncbi:MAG: alpha-L-fucosidase [Fibrobacterota bacterium]|nr:MAG: alpha-L-fucosidase [Fibrobacterota bacterium]
MKSLLGTMRWSSVTALALATSLPIFVRAQAPVPYGAVPNARQIEWFHRERQIFLHFGVNTFTNVEWGTGNENPSVFNPTALDVGQWMRTIKNGGFTSAILVAKHHDGFCHWPSAYTTQDVASSPWKGGKGDLVQEFVDSCRAYGIKPGIYMSIGDFHSEKLGNYADYYLNQEREILHNYGKIWEIWWDGANAKNNDSTTMKMYADSVRKWAPDCVIWSDAKAKNVTADARWIGTESGQGTGDPNWATEDMAFSNLGSGVRGGSVYCPAEVNSSIRPGWFWHESENGSVNTVDVLWNKYFQSVGRNATWLLNLPPDNRGLIYTTDSIRVDSLNGWINGTFSTNLATLATVSTNHPRGVGYEPSNLVDTAEATYYATPDGMNTDTVLFDLGSPKTFDVLMLREVIELGHRTTGWSVDVSSDNVSYSSLLANKQSIGYKWLEKFNPVTARYVRVRITKGQASVALNSFGVYKKRYVRPSSQLDAILAPKGRSLSEKSVAVTLFGSLVELPPSFAGKPFTAELLDLRGQTVAITNVDAKHAQRGAKPFAKLEHSGLYLVRCTGEIGVVVRKFVAE